MKSITFKSVVLASALFLSSCAHQSGSGDAKQCACGKKAGEVQASTGKSCPHCGEGKTCGAACKEKGCTGGGGCTCKH